MGESSAARGARALLRGARSAAQQAFFMKQQTGRPAQPLTILKSSHPSPSSNPRIIEIIESVVSVDSVLIFARERRDFWSGWSVVAGARETRRKPAQLRPIVRPRSLSLGDAARASPRSS